VTPQTILWILPHLILGYYLFNEVGKLPIVIVVLSALSILGDVSYYIIGFSMATISVAGTPINYLSYAVSASFIPIAVWFFLRLLSPRLHHKAGALSKSLLDGLRLKSLLVLYISTSIFMFMQAVVIYTLDLRSVSLFPLLILTISLQCIIFFSLEFERSDRIHKVKKCMQ
jgi:hypothetical protein